MRETNPYSMAGETALITGGGTGIGLGIAKIDEIPVFGHQAGGVVGELAVDGGGSGRCSEGE